MNQLLWLRNDIKSESELRPIYLRVTINGKRAEFTTGVFVKPCEWDVISKKIVGFGVKQFELENWLFAFMDKVRLIKYMVKNDNSLLTIKELKIRLHQLDQLPVSVTELAVSYLTFIKDNPSKFAECTPKHYRYRIAHYVDFLRLVNLENESANTILTSHLDKFVGYLDAKGYKKSYQNKVVGCVKGMYNWACATGILQNNPVQYFKNVRPSKPTKVYLNETQIKQVENYQFSSPHIQKAADLFILQFHTGMAYVDTQVFSLANHGYLHNGVTWAIIPRQKSGTLTRVPLSSTVLDLVAKYGGQAPKFVMQRYNLYLKEIANIIGFDLKLTSHVGRKTALNHWLESGIKLETVSAMAGHSSTKVTQSHYTEVSISKMENDISPHFLALNVQPYRQQPLLP